MDTRTDAQISTGDALIALAMAKRAAAGLHVRWQLPDGSTFNAYPVDDAMKARWIASKAKLGWVVI